MHIDTNTYSHICIYMYIYSYMYISMCADIYTHARAQAYAYVRIPAWPGESRGRRPVEGRAEGRKLGQVDVGLRPNERGVRYVCAHLHIHTHVYIYTYLKSEMGR